MLSLSSKKKKKGKRKEILYLDCGQRIDSPKWYNSPKWYVFVNNSTREVFGYYKCSIPLCKLLSHKKNLLLQYISPKIFAFSV